MEKSQMRVCTHTIHMTTLQMLTLMNQILKTIKKQLMIQLLALLLLSKAAPFCLMYQIDRIRRF